MFRDTGKIDPQWKLPDGLTEEMLIDYARNRENARRRADYARHPERVERQRMTTYTNFLNRHGKLVIPAPPPPPWTDLQERCLLNMLKAALQEVNQERGGDNVND